MKAKLKLFIALCHNASLLILDEPTAGMDVVARDEVLTLLREYMEEDESRAILISSHISGDLEGLCDDIYMIHEGRIVLHEDTDRLLSSCLLYTSHLGNGNQIRKFLHGEPVIQGNDLVLNQRHGRIAASEAEQADLKETEKQMKVNHDGSPFLPGINVFSRPTAMQTRMRCV